METPNPKNNSIEEAIAIHGLLLSEDELLIYKDEQAEYHVLCTKPYDKAKNYKIIYMTWEDLPQKAPVTAPSV